MKIFYLNVNNFFGDSLIKKILYDNGIEYKIKECRTDGMNKFISESLIKKITDTDKPYDMIFLSEIDPYFKSMEKIITKMEEKGYKYVLPNAIEDNSHINKKIFSITICFLKNEIADNWLNNEKSNISMGNWLSHCEIGGTGKNELLIVGLHARKRYMVDFEKFAEEDSCKYKNNPFVIFGDFNIDANAPGSKTEERLKKIITNLSAEEIIDKMGKLTFKNLTKIDRVITNIKDVKIYIDESYYEEGLSDHSALVINLPENIEKIVKNNETNK